MSTRAIVAFNLDRLMKKTPNLNTQPKVHEKTGLSQSTISRILRKDASIGLDVLESLADAFACDVAEFFYPIDGSKPSPSNNLSLEEMDFGCLSRSEKVRAVKILMDLIDSQD